MRSRLDPGGFVPRHLHLRQDERLEVLAGSVRFSSSGLTAEPSTTTAPLKIAA